MYNDMKVKLKNIEIFDAIQFIDIDSGNEILHLLSPLCDFVTLDINKGIIYIDRPYTAITLNLNSWLVMDTKDGQIIKFEIYSDERFKEMYCEI
jgi:hypothetical protein